MSYKICVVTGTRAEYGILSGVIRGIEQSAVLDLSLVVTGSHLASEFGSTYQEILADGHQIETYIPILTEADSRLGMALAVSQGINLFSSYFAENKPEMLLILGDRFEIFAVVCAAVIMQVPVTHLYGGETTMGAIDEYFRHAMTKMSALHFTAAAEYARRVVQMGEPPHNVYHVGSLGVENIRSMQLLSRQELSEDLGISLDRPYALVTYHPETLAETSVEDALKALFQALDDWSNQGNQVIITKANADTQGRFINEQLDIYAAERPKVQVYASLGALRYLSAMKYAAMVVGNSSSGIIEAPSFKVPAVNIGDRQQGRIMAESVLSCTADYSGIIAAMQKASDPIWRKKLTKIQSPYEKADTGKNIVRILEERIVEGRSLLKKKFCDLPFSL